MRLCRRGTEPAAEARVRRGAPAQPGADAAEHPGDREFNRYGDERHDPERGLEVAAKTIELIPVHRHQAGPPGDGSHLLISLTPRTISDSLTPWTRGRQDARGEVEAGQAQRHRRQRRQRCLASRRRRRLNLIIRLRTPRPSPRREGCVASRHLTAMLKASILRRGVPRVC
jgi:hypothetical protein